ncbi:MAG: flagellar assembly peptidoglycan hydrolase FlgJ [Comamonas sp.]
MAAEGLRDAAASAVYDVRNLDRLRGQAQGAPQSADTQRQVAREFEALFLNMMIQRMREATPRQGLFDSEQTRLVQSLADQQMASALANPGIGLAQALLRQMQQQGGSAQAQAAAQGAATPGAVPAAAGEQAGVAGRVAAWLGLLDGAAGRRQAAGDVSASGAAPALSAVSAAGGLLSRVADFVGRLVPVARQVAQASGIPLKLMLGQAALESGWGQREIRHADGSPSHNLFGIKATGGWRGKTVDVVTTEYADGVSRKLTQTFRAYDSYAEAFRDYASLITGSPRYGGVLEAADHNEAARRIQQAGYATDPVYADKLIRVMALMDG